MDDTREIIAKMIDFLRVAHDAPNLVIIGDKEEWAETAHFMQGAVGKAIEIAEKACNQVRRLKKRELQGDDDFTNKLVCPVCGGPVRVVGGDPWDGPEGQTLSYTAMRMVGDRDANGWRQGWRDGALVEE